MLGLWFTRVFDFLESDTK